MKKLISALMCAALMILLCSCSTEEPNITVSADSDEPAQQQTPADADNDSSMPEIPAEAPVTPDIAPSAYSYVPFTLENSGFYMEVPSHWERRPATSSVYFVEPVDEGEIPGRIVVTSKKVSKVNDSTRDNQLRSYFTNILGDFDTYEWSDIYTDQPFMGDDKALWVTYSGTRDGLAYRGYVILGVKNSTVYVFHFRCADAEFYDFDRVIDHVRDSITIN